MSDDLEKRIQRLEDIDAIKTLKHKTWRYYDTQNIEELRKLFTDDIVISTAPPASSEFRGLDQMMENTKKAFEVSIASHQGHGAVIEFTSETTAKAYWSIDEWFYYFDRGEEWHAKGYYLDEYVKIDGVWKVSRLQTKFNFKETFTRGR
ncbi:nuclear transport factor 2 family protein [Pseudonocardia halophobica]|uniref:nuclear transport factor 2 family protein n=1 Tax=Pseudonocardia halophobica TaxID=29401 RepID=UPI003D91D8E7